MSFLGLPYQITTSWGTLLSDISGRWKSTIQVHQQGWFMGPVRENLSNPFSEFLVAISNPRHFLAHTDIIPTSARLHTVLSTPCLCFLFL